jgi:hypothetical protein
MKIKDINIVNRDPLGARTLEIRTSKIDIVTPDRGVTSTEAGYKKEIQVYYPIDDPFENTIFEAIQHFTKKQVKELHTKNGAFKTRKWNLTAVVRNHDDMLTKYFPKMRQDIVLDLYDVQALVDLQIESGLDIISIPDISIDSKPREYEKHILQFAKYIEERADAKPMPYIDMASNDELFKNKYKVILDNDGTFSCIGMTYRPIDDHRANYYYLSKNGDNEIWIHASNVGRTYNKTDTAQLHIPQRYAIDTCTMESRRGGGEISLKPLEDLKVFDPLTLGQIPFNIYKEDRGHEPNCLYPFSNKNVGEFVDVFRDGSNPIDTLNLEKGLKLHESFTSPEEFANSRLAIKEDEFRRYIKSRTYLNKSFSGIGSMPPLV